MNYKFLALGVIGLTFLFQTYVEWLYIKSAERDIPENVRDVYEEKSYQKWLQYFKEKNRVSLFRHIAKYIMVFLVFGFDVYARIVSGLSLNGDYAAAIVVLAADLLFSLIYEVPAGSVNSMVVEQKYGFNRMTKKTFVI